MSSHFRRGHLVQLVVAACGASGAAAAWSRDADGGAAQAVNFTDLKQYARGDLRLGFEKGDQTTLELFVKNVANDRSWTTVARQNNLGVTPLTSYARMGVVVTPQEERSFGVRLHHGF